MKTLQFKCTLLSDVILNQKAASDGPNKTLDYIPGACFLGIVAGKVYAEGLDKEAMEVVHSGRVRFGDAHPSNGGYRSNRVPAVLYYPKLSNPSENLYVHSRINDYDSVRHLQLKQCRSGFYDFSSYEAVCIHTGKNISMKSAYDPQTRRSEDEKLYVYESLQRGLEMLFSVEVDNDVYVGLVRDSLLGVQRVGRSRNAQYGLVQIEECSYSEVGSLPAKDDLVFVYADSRLVFLDEYGLPKNDLTPKDLDIDDPASEIVWDKTHLLFFQYAPWNYKRKCFDTDRCGIEKGSVIAVRTSAKIGSHIKYVGSYRNEGFGRVVFNPDFLASDDAGRSRYRLASGQAGVTSDAPVPMDGTLLLRYVALRKDEEERDKKVYRLVNDTVRQWTGIFHGDAFASQWGTIRSIASQYNEKEVILRMVKDYVSKGVAKDKWAAKGRKDKLSAFMESVEPEICQKAVVNLCAEMAKKCKKQ